jgi:hypothetical protein
MYTKFVLTESESIKDFFTGTYLSSNSEFSSFLSYDEKVVKIKSKQAFITFTLADVSQVEVRPYLISIIARFEKTNRMVICNLHNSLFSISFEDFL